MVWAFVVILAVAAVMDVLDRRRKQARRTASEMLRRRHDELADVWSTQHSGYCQFPQHDMHKHRDALDARTRAS